MTFTPNNIEIQNNVIIDGTLTISPPSSLSTFSADKSVITINGGATMDSLTVIGNAMSDSATIKSLTVHGDTNLSSMTVSGEAMIDSLVVSSITLNNNLDVDSLTVSGEATIDTVSSGDIRLWGIQDTMNNWPYFGQNWSNIYQYFQINAQQNFDTLCLSASGQYATTCIDGGSIFTSMDYGHTFTPDSSNKNWSEVCMSYSGQYQLITAQGDYVYVSSDFGKTFLPTATVQDWSFCAISGTGQYMMAQYVSDTGFYVALSSNYGKTWQIIPGSFNWNPLGMAISGSGQYMTVVSGINSVNTIHTSNDYGITWILANVPNTSPYYDVSISTTGQYQLATTLGNVVLLSTDFGKTWTSIVVGPVSTEWLFSAMSASGQYQIINGIHAPMYFSVDYGQSWSSTQYQILTSGPVAISATGQFSMAVGAFNGSYSNIYMSNSAIAQNLQIGEIINPPYSFSHGLPSSYFAVPNQWYVLNPQVASTIVPLPDATIYLPGSWFGFINNSNSYTVSLKDPNTSFAYVLPASNSSVRFLITTSSQWVVIAFYNMIL
jgi:photosystem II stability/assembly factor-like uncharacterized protein